jgi:hypothetical protein
LGATPEYKTVWMFALKVFRRRVLGRLMIFCRNTGFGVSVAALLVACLAAPANAVVSFDASVTSNAIFGSGNANGGYTVDRSNGIELGLRGKLRFNAANQPENTFNSNGDGSYSFAAGQPAGVGFGFAPGSASTAVWNFEWSVNTNFDNSTGQFLNDLNYELGIDFDPGIGTNYLTFDPINQSQADHSIGTNATGQGQGQEAGDAAEYAALIGANNLAQNSWNMEFFDGGAFPFDANSAGIFDFYLTASDQFGERARVDMRIISVGANAEVAEPGALGLLGLSLAALSLMRRRRHTKNPVSNPVH